MIRLVFEVPMQMQMQMTYAGRNLEEKRREKGRMNCDI